MELLWVWVHLVKKKAEQNGVKNSFVLAAVTQTQ